MFGSFNRGFNRGQRDGIAAMGTLLKSIAIPAIEARIDSDAAEIRALKAENKLLRQNLADLRAQHVVNEGKQGK